MTVDDFSIYGISASILFSLASIAIALFAVYFTYKQAKISHNQFELELKKVEKPRVVENIQNTLNSIENELTQELRTINGKDLFWVIPNEYNNFYMGSLVFPLSRLKFFYDNFLSIFQGPDIKRNVEIATRIHSISLNLKKRFEIYQKIDQKLRMLITEIEESHYTQRREDLLAKTDRFKIISESSENGGPLFFFQDHIGNYRLSEDNVDNILKSMLVSTIFKPLKKDELRLGLGFSTFTGEIYDKIPDILAKDPIPKSEKIKKSIEELLHSLKTLDENILGDIKYVKEIYREIYTLKESELNPPQGLLV